MSLELSIYSSRSMLHFKLQVEYSIQWTRGWRKQFQEGRLPVPWYVAFAVRYFSLYSLPVCCSQAVYDRRCAPYLASVAFGLWLEIGRLIDRYVAMRALHSDFSILMVIVLKGVAVLTYSSALCGLHFPPGVKNNHRSSVRRLTASSECLPRTSKSIIPSTSSPFCYHFYCAVQRGELLPDDCLFDLGLRSLSNLHARFHLVGGTTEIRLRRRRT